METCLICSCRTTNYHLLIAPIWNGNDIPPQLPHRPKQLLIAPIWNGNGSVEYDDIVPFDSFNRTNLEWKLSYAEQCRAACRAFNRTNLEWKPRDEAYKHAPSS